MPDSRQVRSSSIATIPDGNRQTPYRPPVVGAFLRSTASAKTENQMNKAIIRFEDVLTAREIFTLSNLLDHSLYSHFSLKDRALLELALRAHRFPSPFRSFLANVEASSRDFKLLKWVRKLREFVSRNARRDELSLERVYSRKSNIYFRSVVDHPTTLLIAFSSGAARMGMPTPLFLSGLEGVRPDVLLLRARFGSSQLNGVKGIGGDFPEVAQYLRSFVDVGGYRSVATAGVSMGVAPALHFGLALGASAIIVDGPGGLLKGNHLPSLDQRIKGVDAFPRVTVSYGSSAAQDKLAAVNLREVFPEAHLVEVPDAPHDSLYPLAVKGLLRPHFDAALGT